MAYDSLRRSDLMEKGGVRQGFGLNNCFLLGFETERTAR